MKLIKLNQSTAKGRARNLVAQVDDEDFEYLNKFSWHINKYKHVSYAESNFKLNNGKYKMIKMHRVIMNTEPDMICDHINHDGLDCQKHNLRNCTRSENAKNVTSHKNSSSNFLGVSKAIFKNRVYWLAQITIINSKKKKSWYFPYTLEGEIQAAKAYNEAAIKYHGEFANLNIIPVDK